MQENKLNGKAWNLYQKQSKRTKVYIKCIVNLSGRIKLAVTADTYVKLNEVLWVFWTKITMLILNLMGWYVDFKFN